MPHQSPSQTVGPFFHNALIDSTERQLAQDEAHGEHIIIRGQVLDGDGEPVPDALVEIWQADGYGYFNHPADPHQPQADPAFRGFGRSDTVDAGQYSFHTVKPGIIPGQEAPFINLRIFARGLLIHVVTRLYFEGESGNRLDYVLNSVPAGRRGTLIARQVGGAELPTYHFDIHLQGPRETVFFDA